MDPHDVAARYELTSGTQVGTSTGSAPGPRTPRSDHGEGDRPSGALGDAEPKPADEAIMHSKRLEEMISV
ncbi:MAG: hypothetical protein R2789_18340 [Microthrixaceae bacterium]